MARSASSREAVCAKGSKACCTARRAPGSSARYDLGIPGSVGQNRHAPGHPAGSVRTVTVATPDSVRTGFMRMRRSSVGSAGQAPLSVSWR